MAELFQFTHTEAVLQEYAKAAEAIYKDNLLASGHLAGAGLLNSIHTEVVRGEHSVAVDMDLAEYWKYVEYDTRPHFPPVSALLRWVQIKPILPTPDKKGRIPTPKQLAFLIGRKIAKEGTKGTHDLEHTMERLNTAYEAKIEAAIVADLGNATDAIISTFARGV